MPSEAEFWRAAAEVVAARGGLVVGFTEDSDQPELGSTLDNVLGFTPPHRPTVVKLSDWTDWTEQVELFYRLRPSWGRGKAGDPHATYYRVKFPSLDGFNGNSSSGSITTLPSLDNRLSIPSFGEYSEPTGTLKGVAFWRRAGARLIDYALHYGSSLVAGRIFRILLDVASGGQPPLWIFVRLTRAHFPLFITGLLGYIAYESISTAIDGRSLGKRLLSLQVVQEDGSPCRLRSAIVREVGFIVDSLFFGFVGYSAMGDDPLQQRLGDQWAQTVVVKSDAAHSRDNGMRFVLALMAGIGTDIALMMLGLLIRIL